MKTFRKLALFTLVIMAVPLSAYAQDRTSYFDSTWLKSLISIEAESKTDKGTVYSPLGTGFLVQTPEDHTALVTAKHVIYDDKTKKIREKLVYRLNRKGKNSDPVSEAYVSALVKTDWICSDKYDIAARLMVWKNDNDMARIPINSILKSDPDVGANVYVIGFPLGLRSEVYSKPIVRQGIVSLVDDPFLVDAFTFPGNSGGPVIYVPIIPFGKGVKTNVLQQNILIGLVIENITHLDVATSLQTKRTRMIFEENIGLCKVLQSKTILEFLKSDRFAEADKNSYSGIKPLQEDNMPVPGN